MSLPVRLGFVYAAIYVGVGAASPYMPVWFAHRGLSGAEIGMILAAPGLARAVTGPALAIFADRFRLRRTPVAMLAAASALLTVLMAAPFGFWWWFWIFSFAATLNMAVAPLTDVLALRRAARDGFNYGWPRGIGSAAFIVANVAMGFLLVRGSPELVLAWMAASGVLLAVAARLFLPPDPVREPDHAAGAADRWAGLGGLLRDREFMLAVVSVGLIQSAHAFYYGFSTLTWTAQGIPESVTGMLWGAAVLVEVAFLWFMEPFRRRMGIRNLLVLGGAGSVVRWVALAFAPPLWLLFPLQALHTLTYAATFIASLQIVERFCTSRNASAAQQINAALSSGVLAGLAAIASGWLFDRVGSQGYFAMAIMAALGLAGALSLYRIRRLDP